MEALERNLKTIEHLKKYKPKHRASRSSGLFSGFAPALTPTLRPFGVRSAANTPAEERAHFFSGATSRADSPTVSRKGTPDLYDDGHAGDLEDNSPGSSKKGKGKAKHVKVKEEPISISTPIESRPDSPAAGKLFTNTMPDHFYPPTPSPRPSRRNSNDSDENAVLQAGKVLKKAVLHDARNLTGKEDTDIAGLGWAVGSTDEARVRSGVIDIKTEVELIFKIATCSFYLRSFQDGPAQEVSGCGRFLSCVPES